jgi:RNA polymerase sigma-70 factor, ECF subfamily
MRNITSLFSATHSGDWEIITLARDKTAETFLKAFNKISFFEWRNISLSSWIFRIATNEINQFYRKAKYRPAFLEDIQFSQQLPNEPGIETERAALEKQAAENEEFLKVQRELARLDTKYQEVISLRYFEEKSIKEIAEILNKKEGTVKSLISRGLDKLKERVYNPGSSA